MSLPVEAGDDEEAMVWRHMGRLQWNLVDGMHLQFLDFSGTLWMHLQFLDRVSNLVDAFTVLRQRI